MNRAAAPLALAFCLTACAILGGCAAPGEPVARHPVVPAAIADLGARQYGNAFTLAFTLPNKSADREDLPERPSVEIYRALLGPGAAPDKKTVWRLAYTIPSEQVDRYLKGEQFEFRDILEASDFAQAPGSSIAYEVKTRVVAARASRESNIVVARIYPPPEAPRDVHVEVTEPALAVTWSDAPVPPGASSRAYRVYRGVLESGDAEAVARDLSQAKFKTPPEPVGDSPSPEFRDAHFEFGTTYLYTVRSVAQFGAEWVESADSDPAVVTARDVFPPAVPTGLEAALIPATAQAPAYVELSWAISPEGDLAGYSVYKSNSEDSPGERISTEVLPSPAFRDTSVEPGQRYFYRVTAVDRAGNESPRSAAVAVAVP